MSETIQSDRRDNVPVFWRYFGGTLISVLAVLLITLLGHLLSQINSVQVSITQLSADSVRKAEFAERTTSIWNSLRGIDPLREKITQLEKILEKNESVTVLKDKFLILESEVKKAEEKMTLLRERIAALEGAKKPDAKSQQP